MDSEVTRGPGADPLDSDSTVDSDGGDGATSIQTPSDVSTMDIASMPIHPQVGVGLAQTPAGTLIVVKVMLGTMSVDFGIPLDLADTFADNLSGGIKHLAAEGRRMASGLILPHETGRPAHNGHHRPRNPHRR